MYLRKGNLKFTVTQDNISQGIIIDDFVQSVDKRDEGDFFGYKGAELEGKSLFGILPEDICEILNDNIEYTVEGNDFKSVVEKIIRFKVLSKDKQSFDMNAHVEMREADNDRMVFEMVLEKRIHLKEKINNILSGINAVQRVEHPKAKLMSSDVYCQVLDEVFDFLYDAKIPAVMLVLSVDGYPMLRRSLGRKGSDEVLKKISYVIKSTLRTRDIVSYLGVGHFAVTMIKTYPDEVVYPLKRLLSNLKREGVISSKVSVNVRYKAVDLELDVAEVIEQVKMKDIDDSFKV